MCDPQGEQGPDGPPGPSEFVNPPEDLYIKGEKVGETVLFCRFCRGSAVKLFEFCRGSAVVLPINGEGSTFCNHKPSFFIFNITLQQSYVL